MADILKAEGIAIALGTMIGSRPAVVNIDGQYLEIQFSEDQKRAFMAYLDQRVDPLFSNQPRPAPTIQVRWGDVLVPWSIKYLAPAIVAVFAMGYMTNMVFNPRRG
jgi:hypothetical protein